VCVDFGAGRGLLNVLVANQISRVPARNLWSDDGVGPALESGGTLVMKTDGSAFVPAPPPPPGGSNTIERERDIALRNISITRDAHGRVGLRFARPHGAFRGPFEITSLVRGGAAERSDVRLVGFLFVAVDGGDVESIDDDAVAALLRGAPYTTFTLTGWGGGGGGAAEMRERVVTQRRLKAEQEQTRQEAERKRTEDEQHRLKTEQERTRQGAERKRTEGEQHSRRPGAGPGARSVTFDEDAVQGARERTATSADRSSLGRSEMERRKRVEAEAAAEAKKRQEEQVRSEMEMRKRVEAAAAAAEATEAKKRQEEQARAEMERRRNEKVEEAAAAAAVKKRQEEQASAEMERRRKEEAARAAEAAAKKRGEEQARAEMKRRKEATVEAEAVKEQAGMAEWAAGHEIRGPCTFCGKPVMQRDARYKGPAGYCHAQCFVSANSSLQGKAGDGANFMLPGVRSPSKAERERFAPPRPNAPAKALVGAFGNQAGLQQARTRPATSHRQPGPTQPQRHHVVQQGPGTARRGPVVMRPQTAPRMPGPAMPKGMGSGFRV